MIMNWLVLVVFIVFFLCIAAGIKRGIIKTIYSIGVVAAGLLLSAMLNPIVSNFLHNNNSIYQTVYQAVEENIAIEGKIKTLQQETNIIEMLPLPETMKKKIKENNNKEIYQAMDVENFKQYIYAYITNMILNTISYLILFIVISVMLFMLARMLDLISKLPVIKQLNKLAGGVAGALQGLLIFWIFTAILTIWANTPWAQNLYGMINESSLLSFLYTHNLLITIVTNIKMSFVAALPIIKY